MLWVKLYMFSNPIDAPVQFMTEELVVWDILHWWCNILIFMTFCWNGASFLCLFFRPFSIIDIIKETTEQFLALYKQEYWDIHTNTEVM